MKNNEKGSIEPITGFLVVWLFSVFFVGLSSEMHRVKQEKDSAEPNLVGLQDHQDNKKLEEIKNEDRKD